jgi:nucleoside-diphosphate-sugar epimerase
MKNVLITGGAGYIGSVLVRKLLARRFAVCVCDALHYNNGCSLLDVYENPRFSLIRGDFCDTRILEEALSDVTDVVHLAALVGDPICKKYPAQARMINEEGTIRLFNSLDGRRINTFTFTSTCSNYGLISSGEYATEKSVLNPQSLYAETKVNAENYMLEHMGNRDFCPTILRLSTAYGFSERMRFDLTISEFTRTIALGRELTVYDEDTWRPYCHVEDISEAIIAVIESQRDSVGGEVFNVGSNDSNYTKKMIVQAILALAPGAKVIYKEGGHDRRNYRVSFDKIRSRLGFVPRHTLDGFIRAMLNAIQNGLFDDVESRSHFYGNYVIRQTPKES